MTPSALRTFPLSSASPLPVSGHRRSLLLVLQQRVCGAKTGHDLMRRVENRRLRLVCRHCLYETPGWETGRP